MRHRYRFYYIFYLLLKDWWLRHVLPYSKPTYIYQDGEDLWMSHGLLHHATEPARVAKNGSRQWYWCGLRHRMDGPAIEDPDGTQQWYQHGLRHRKDKPAYTTSMGVEMWLQDDQFHRINGPAIIDAQGDYYWWYKGVLYVDPKELRKLSSLSTVPNLLIMSMIAHAPTLERLLADEVYYEKACSVMPELPMYLTANISTDLIAIRAHDILHGIRSYPQYEVPSNLEL